MRQDHLQLHNEAFIKYYDTYSDDIFRFCMVKVSNRDTALDITQETFMKFWEYMASGKTIDNHRALLYKMANNLVIDRYRKKKDVLVEDYSTIDSQNDLSFDPRRQLQDNVDGQRALLLLKELPDSSREIVTLAFLDNLSIAEIASIVKRNPKTVSVYLHRGLKRIRELIESYE